MPLDKPNLDSDATQARHSAEHPASPREPLPTLNSMAPSGMLSTELQSPHLVVFSGGTAFNGIAGYMRKEFPRGKLLLHSGLHTLQYCT